MGKGWTRLGSVVSQRGQCYTRVCVRGDMPKEGARCASQHCLCLHYLVYQSAVRTLSASFHPWKATALYFVHMHSVWILYVWEDACLKAGLLFSCLSCFPLRNCRWWQTVLELQAFCDSRLLFASDQRPQKSPAALNPQSPSPVRHLWRHPAARKHPNNFWALIVCNWSQWAQKRLLFSIERAEKWCVASRACCSALHIPPRFNEVPE